MPPTPVAGFGRRDEPTSEFEEPTPGQVPPGYAAAGGRTPPPLALGPPDVEVEAARLDAAGRGQPLQPFPLDAELSSPFAPAAEGSPHAARLSAMPDLPPTTDFTVDLSSNASGRSGRASGPPTWLFIGGLLVALGGGAALGARVTTAELGSILSTVADLEQRAGRLTATDAARAALPRTDDGQPLPPAAEAAPATPPPSGDPAERREGHTAPGDAQRAVEGSAADGSEAHPSPSGAKHAHPGGGSSGGTRKGSHAASRAPKPR
jgi:hypothetical protein